jgi:hypothetical protein
MKCGEDRKIWGQKNPSFGIAVIPADGHFSAFHFFAFSSWAEKAEIVEAKK